MGMDRKIKKKFWTTGRIATIAGIVIVAFLLISAYLNSGKSRLNVQRDRLLLDTIHTAVFKEFITVFGTVEPLKTVYLDAVESGKVEEIFVEDGSMVEKEQPILRLSNLDLQLQAITSEANLINQISDIRYQTIIQEQQSINLRERALNIDLQIDLFGQRTERNRLLYEDSVISEVEYQEARDEYQNLLQRKKLMLVSIEKDSIVQDAQRQRMESTLDLMKRNLEFAQNSLDNLTIKAPIEGQISSLDSEVGELIGEGSRVAQIDVVDDFKILARIDEFYISRIFTQQDASFTMDGKTYQLKIKKIYPEVTNGAFEVDLIFVGDRPDNIRRGQSISLRISLSDETQARLLAKGGFFQTTGGNWVYIMGEDGIARRRDIRLGRQNPNFYEVQEGLMDGDVVIISSYENYGEKDELIIQ